MRATWGCPGSFGIKVDLARAATVPLTVAVILDNDTRVPAKIERDTVVVELSDDLLEELYSRPNVDRFKDDIEGQHTFVVGYVLLVQDEPVQTGPLSIDHRCTERLSAPGVTSRSPSNANNPRSTQGHQFDHGIGGGPGGFDGSFFSEDELFV